ncbi:hypothetical protein [Telluria beijingensis]|uniref:hypothetical protein n=1 Tax=Telluria beijingensis TaxID=3068633 RepID=UPI0027952571|nr:hypothetical protein [Massilia sp. REN29]
MTFRHYPNGSAGAVGAAIRQARRHLCARLAHTADAGCTPDDCFVRTFPSVVTAVEVGFRHEETVMESLDYERLHEHRAENATILAALHRALPLVEDGDVTLGRQLVAALLDLLSLHRLSTDLVLATTPRTPAGRPGGHVPRILLRGGAHAGSRSRQH